MPVSAEEGRRIISITKSLEAFQRGDQQISQYFSATTLAGQAGLFLSSLRKHKKMRSGKFRTLAASAHINGVILDKIIIPWMRKRGFIDGDTVTPNGIVTCNVLDYKAVLEATSELFHENNPTSEEGLVLGIVEEGTRAPQSKSDIFNANVSANDETLERALGLAKTYKIVNILEGAGVREPIVYSPLIWGDNITKIGKALSHLDRTRKEMVLKLLEMVRKYQGLPYDDAVEWAKKEGDEKLIEFSVSLKLIDRTIITTALEERRVFLTTPHLYGEVGTIHGKDVCDKIRIFLDSIRHGQHYGQWYTGRINDPVALLDKLVDKGEIGPCTAIGRDYQLVEKAGIINVRESKLKSGQFIMRLVQEDTVETVRDIIAREPWRAGSARSRSDGKFGQEYFTSAEATRITIGEPAGRVREAEIAILKSLREA